MRIHVIGPVLRVIFNNEDRELRPDAALRDRFDDLADGDVVRGDLRFRRERARRRALGVILAKRHEHEVRDRAFPIHLLELFDETIGARVVARPRRFRPCGALLHHRIQGLLLEAGAANLGDPAAVAHAERHHLQAMLLRQLPDVRRGLLETPPPVMSAPCFE